MASRPPQHSSKARGATPFSRVVLELRESISLRTQDGLFFGELLRFGAGRMEVECDGRFDLRSEVEFQLKLPGFNTTVYGVARVLRAISRTALIRQYTIRIIRMRDKDRMQLQQWVDYSYRGRTTDQSGGETAYDPKVEPNPWGIHSLDSNVQTTAGKLALRDAMRARFTPSSVGASREQGGSGRRQRADVPAGRSPSSGRATTTGQAQASDGSVPRIGRESIGAAIKQGGRSSRRRGEPELSDQEGRGARQSTPPRPSRRQRRQLRRPPLVEVDSPKAPKLPSPKDPQVHMRLSANPPQVFVRYHTRSGYFGDYQSYLSKNVLFLQNTEETPKKGSVLRVNIFLPAGISVQCEGVVIATLPNGFGLNLQLSAEGRMTLASASKI
jgi:hypothetical protein